MKKPSLKKLKPKKFFKKQEKTLHSQKEKRKTSFKFPNIPRICTEQELFVYDRLKIVKRMKLDKVAALGVIVLVSLVIIVLIGIVGADISMKTNRKYQAEGEYQKLMSQLQYWESVVGKHKDYKDGYFQLAILAYQLKQFDKARWYVQKTLDLDPNSKSAQEFANILEGK